MKAKMGEIDGKMVIYRRNLGQNSRWNTNLPLKFKSGRWITNWDKSGRWITLLTRGKSKPSDRAGERSEKSAKNRRFIAEISPIFRGHRRLFGEIADLSAIYWRFIAKNRPPDFSPGNVVSPLPDTRYIGDISPIFPDIFLHEQDEVCHKMYFLNDQ